MVFKTDPTKCRHNQGFSLIEFRVTEGGQIVDEGYAWFCWCGCGYKLNFDPVKFPDCIAYVTKKERKVIPLLVPSKY